MYFFLLNLSLLDLGTVSTTVPKSMANSLWDTRAISYSGCAAQVFLFAFLLGGEYYLLTVMAYDRYVAICKPLHYGTLMGSRACVKMAAAAWASGFLNSLLHTGNTFSIPLCQGNTVDQFFCEIPQILKLSCSDSYFTEVGFIVVTAFLGFGCFIFIVLSYVQIFTAVLRFPSEQGQHKAFSMCLPHLAVVSLFLSTVMFAYLKPHSVSSPAVDLVVAVLYAVVPPAVNPLIYSMRNKELKDALRKLENRRVHHSLPRCGEELLEVFSSHACFPQLCPGIGTQALPWVMLGLHTFSSKTTTVMFAYLQPPSVSAPTLDLVLSVLDSVVPPTLNPLIYSMRNKELKEALRKLVQLALFQHQ
ncbi:olfactory receptor 14C36-like [Apteryx rowi]|uniref:olfactory receptor 14C36-like n=1 Tax=Apteryx rowi TaxID=308060 RepID=UPI000E1D50F3|nr:olfactory receptor 14C36-like [Apteryx rowi]